MSDELTIDIINSIQHPTGWDLVEDPEQLIPRLNKVELAELRKFINTNVATATNTIEQYLKAVKANAGIEIKETYFAVEADLGTHILFLVVQEDFLSPHIQAAKVLADRYFGGNDNIGYRYSFSIMEEHLKLSFFDDTHKVRYVLRSFRNRN